MQHRLFFFLFTFLFLQVSTAQNYSSIKNGNRISYAQGIAAPGFFLSNDSIIYSASRTNNSLTNLCLRKFDRFGNTTDSNYFDFNFLSSFIHLRQNAVKNSSVNTFVLLDFIDSTFAYPTLIKLNDSLDTINQIYIKDSIYNVFGFDYLIEDSTITVVCQLNRHVYNDQQLLILQYDTALNLLWQNTIVDWRPQQGGYFPTQIIRMHDAYYISGHCEYPSWIEGFVVKTNLQGQLVWDQRFRNGIGNSGVRSMVVLDDTIYLHINENNSTGWDITLWLAKIDTAGTLLSDSLYAPLYKLQTADMIKSADGNLIISGYYENSFTYNANGIIYKIDRNFNTLWQRSYVHQSSYNVNRLWQIHQWPDGSLLATGSVDWLYNRPPGVPHDHVWLLSLDSNGCLAPGNCGVLAVTEEAFTTEKNGLLLYPNPATDMVNLVFEGLDDEAIASLYNLQGQKIDSQFLFFDEGKSTYILPPGIVKGSYLFSLITKTEEITVKLVVW